MSHTITDEELTGQAALYALGALDAAEARDFERHVETCAACAAELHAFRCVAGDLALAAMPVAPPDSARARLLALVSESVGHDGRAQSQLQSASKETDDVRADESASGFVVVRAGEGEWRATEDHGVSYKLLFVDRERATVTTLVRMEPGARIRAHRHLGLEQCLILEGDLRSGDIEMSAGDFNCSMPGSVHNELTTDGGALFLIVAPERFEAVAPLPRSVS
ncbi:MAG TPA: cupin domain-containing protein [Pyrinomonadaceae bacterium]|nr:cupin domain-containing protein [Pyrinomonadaceae bacterium]